MKLHENKELFQDAITATSQQKGIPEIYIEKDYWVTLALHSIFNNEIGKETVFKGGTALSKCNQLIDRFSEDIDLVVLRKDGETNNQLKSKLKKISKCVSKVIPEIEIDGITHKMGMIRKTAHSYEKSFDGDFEHVRDTIILESTWLGHFEQYTKGTVSSYIYEMMLKAYQQDIIVQYGMHPFEVLVLSTERTLCEKLMSLVRFSQTEQPITDLRNKIRHTYDIHMMLKDDELNSFFNSKAFDVMLLKVANEDVISFKNNNSWLSNHPINTILFSETENTWNQIKDTYETSFKELVFGEFPSENEIMNTLKLVAERLKTIEWNIETKD
ncbi:nucleotidyl transferase AbiEii/AbiGii toxin family protein [Subsaximicrobium wynnwilliamsii]|uniref:Nucleotidyl transferase AbiEii/AbiGii toxin family protein n=1 Tax=Subsaximicrobium wynnwilliamsii TaxID=291179 RepID=A0A5C6ZB92_9FLAO|nr:nucleotidyl transferase AbiEii/AbiGii toxin family protein [Subsaximicrobium wynnwilliamsii]TXD81117.1 nucleotidyl transferase AbiEii/AbiGii toxin family protein [Subsaximicrobium wynnwilliamsii]TXD86854.1 nucleotidyl transferase AbiEii/AbiGii toxin family protein [Subsaximicrobium wynnwilliamsii]TXE00445.1 nucleotidyl transferase AbiEii/AbiGii toxin family protein [Subsaximicrobium wynnwilliamsii]